MKSRMVMAAMLMFLNPAAAQMNMDMDMGSSSSGMVMGQNTDTLPPGCNEISGQENLTVEAGKMFAEEYPSKVFTYSEKSYEFEPCTKLTVEFTNNDDIRHQWMVHGLPEEVYSMGMFTLEATNGTAEGTFILPAEDETYLVHCGLPQHMQKGMKAQIIVGEGDGEISNIPGRTGNPIGYEYPGQDSGVMAAASVLTALVAGFAVTYFYI